MHAYWKEKSSLKQIVLYFHKDSAKIIFVHYKFLKKSSILLWQNWKNLHFDSTIIISNFEGTNNIFADCRILKKNLICWSNMNTIM